MQDTAPQFQQFPEKITVDLLSDGQDAVCKFLPLASSRLDTIRLKRGTRQSIAAIAAADCIPGDGSTPASTIYGKQVLGVARNMGTDGLTPGEAIRMVEVDVLNSGTPFWHNSVGTSVRQLVYDPQVPRDFYVSPGVPVGRLWIELPFTSAPSRIVNTGTAGTPRYHLAGSATDALSIDDEFVDDLVNYVCARLHLQESKYTDRNKFAVHSALFLSQLNAKVAAVTGNNPNLTTLPGVTQA